jgi:hypothetical protein
MTARPPLPPARRRRIPSTDPGRRNDILRRGVLDALKRSGRYRVVVNARVPVSSAARTAVRRSGGGYLAEALPVDGAGETVVVDLVLDEVGRWAGAFAFAGSGAMSPLARRRIGDDLRAAELLLRSHVATTLDVAVDTVTVGIIDHAADPDGCDDITIAPSEIEASFGIVVPVLEALRIDCG